MHEFRMLTAALAATTLFVGGLGYAADHAHLPVATNGASRQAMSWQAMSSQAMPSGARPAPPDSAGLDIGPLGGTMN